MAHTPVRKCVNDLNKTRQITADFGEFKEQSAKKKQPKT